MKTLKEITVNVDELIGANKYNVDEENAHIKLVGTGAADVPREDFLKLVQVCPAGLYKIDGEGNQSFDYAGCLECGTCRIAAEGGTVASWNNPQPTMGVQYRYG